MKKKIHNHFIKIYTEYLNCKCVLKKYQNLKITRRDVSHNLETYDKMSQIAMCRLISIGKILKNRHITNLRYFFIYIYILLLLFFF